jgi:membrane associated rhomboid family serine protease
LNQKSSPALNTTPAVLALIAVIAALHGLRVMLPDPQANELVVAAGFAPTEFLAALKGYDWGYRNLILASPFTHAFVHGDIMHLGMNLAFLLAFGTIIDRRVGSLRFLALFAVTVLGGAAAVLLTHMITGTQIIVVGASGGVSGLFGAFIRFGLRRRTAAIAIFVGVNLIFAFTGFSSFGETRMIAWDAHLGGFVVGLALFPLFDRRRFIPPAVPRA